MKDEAERARKAPRKPGAPRVSASRAALLTRLRARSDERRALRRRRAGAIFLVAVALLLLLLLRCSCDAPSGAPDAKPAPTAQASASPSPSPRPRKAPRVRPAERGAIDRTRRPPLDVGADAREEWFERFRAQVATRSAAASRCFPGEPRGVLRWDADLLSRDGTASRFAFESVAGLARITEEEKACLATALAAAPFSLGPLGRESVRVSIVIEF